jgi:hypothetical protein
VQDELALACTIGYPDDAIDRYVSLQDFLKLAVSLLQQLGDPSLVFPELLL